MDSHRKIFTAFFISLLVIIAPIPALGSEEECQFPAIINFGDSNSDTGGLSAAFGQAGPPAGETFFHHPAGRYCDGRLIVDFIAKSFGLPYLSAYLDSVGSNFTHGVNFATAGSTIRRQNSTLFQSGFSPFSLDVQSWQYNQFITRSQSAYNRGGVYRELLPTEDVFSQALYTIDIGQNDLTSGYFSNMTTDEVIASVPDILNKLTIVIKILYSQGGRSFWIHNTGPFGCLPYVLDRLPVTAGQVDSVGCAIPFNDVAKYFNQKLKEAVNQLRQELPLAAFTYVDVYSVKFNLIHRAKTHVPLVSCCGHGGKYNYNKNIGCGGSIVVNGTTVVIGKACKDPAHRIIWDGVHYTEATNKWVFDQIASGAFSDPPIPLRMACHRERPIDLNAILLFLLFTNKL